MALTHLVAFNIALLAAIASPGPALLMALKTTLGAGRSAGIAVGAGLRLVAALWTRCWGSRRCLSFFPGPIRS